MILGSTTESISIEFKATVFNWELPAGTVDRERIKREAQKEFCRDVAQFSNTTGGCLVFGIDERVETNTALKVAGSVSPVRSPVALVEWMESAITNFLVPSTLSHDISSIVLTEGVVLAVNIPPSRHIVSVWDRQDGTIEYLCRTSYGKKRMNPDEAERHIMNRSRATKLTITELMDASTSKEIEFTGGILIRPTSEFDRPQRVTLPEPIKLTNLGEETFKVKIWVGSTTYDLTIPFDLVLTAWPGDFGRTNVLLSVRIVIDHSRRIGLEHL